MRKLTGSVCLLLLAATPAMAVQGQEVRSVRSIQPELKVIEENCLNCHNRQRIDSARKERKDAESILKKMEAPDLSHDLFVQYDTDFHVALAKAAKNKVLLMFMVAVKDLHNRVVDYSELHDHLFPAAREYHRKILDAVKDKDPDRAAEMMAEHLDYFEKHFRNHVQSTDFLTERSGKV